MVTVANDVSLDYAEVPDGQEIRPQHYAFLVSEDEFDSIYGHIRDRGLWSIGPTRGAARPGEINHNDGGRGVYFQDPAGPLPGDPHPAVRVGRWLTREASTSTPSPSNVGSIRATGFSAADSSSPRSDVPAWPIGTDSPHSTPCWASSSVLHRPNSRAR